MVKRRAANPFSLVRFQVLPIQNWDEVARACTCIYVVGSIPTVGDTIKGNDDHWKILHTLHFIDGNSWIYLPVNWISSRTHAKVPRIASRNSRLCCYVINCFSLYLVCYMKRFFKRAMSRREIIKKRLHVICVDTIVDIQYIIQQHLLHNQSKENLNKIFKQESLNVIEEMEEDVCKNGNEQ